MRAPHVGLIGCGRWGRNILRDLKSLGASVDVVARSEASRARAQQEQADRIVETAAAMPAVDAVYIATRTHEHADAIESVIDRGIPVFCEKPLTDDVGRAQALAQRAPDRLFVLDKWRYHPGVLAIADIARSGELGEVVGLCTRRVGWGNAHPESTATWVLGPHELAIGLEILDAVLPVRAAVADAARVDEAAARIAGFTAILGDGRVWHSIEVSERSPDRQRSVRLLCRDGGVTLDDPFADHVSVFRIRVGESDPPCETARRAIPGTWPLKTMLAATLGFVRGGPAPKSSAAEGVAIVRRLHEITRAAGFHP